MFDPLFEGAAWLIATFYAWTHNYAIAVGLVAVAVMLLITPLTLKSTKGMLEMQRLQPEMRRLQHEYLADSDRVDPNAWARRGPLTRFTENLANLVSPLL